MPEAVEKVIVERARIEQAATLVVLMKELGYETSQKTIRLQLAQYIASDTSIVLVGIANGDVVGVISGHLIPTLHQPGNVGRITALVIGEKARSKGVASKLLEELEVWFRSNNCLRFEVTS